MNENNNSSMDNPYQNDPEYKKVVDAFFEMGFDHAEAQAALDAAFGNIDLAITYMFAGIPAADDTMGQPPQMFIEPNYVHQQSSSTENNSALIEDDGVSQFVSAFSGEGFDLFSEIENIPQPPFKSSLKAPKAPSKPKPSKVVEPKPLKSSVKTNDLAVAELELYSGNAPKSFENFLDPSDAVLEYYCGSTSEDETSKMVSEVVISTTVLPINPPPISTETANSSSWISKAQIIPSTDELVGLDSVPKFNIPVPVALKRLSTVGREEECNVLDYAKKLEEMSVGSEADEHFLCSSLEGLKDRHHYRKYFNSSSGQQSNMKAIIKELTKELPKKLVVDARHSMFVRYDSEYPQFVQAVLTGMEGSPYSSGIFTFDIFLPSEYPNVPLECTHTTPGASVVKASHSPGGFSPNLHRDSGKVCLSLLGTWSGPGWKKGESNIYQVLSSIQLVILSYDHPYYLEPSYGGWEGTAPKLESDPDKHKVLAYEDEIKFHVAKLCILAPLRNPPIGFESVVLGHLMTKRKLITACLESWIRKNPCPNRLVEKDLSLVLKEIIDVFHSKIGLEEIRQDFLESFSKVKFVREKLLNLSLQLDLLGVDDEETETDCIKESQSTTTSSSTAPFLAEGITTKNKIIKRIRTQIAEGKQLLINQKKDFAIMHAALKSKCGVLNDNIINTSIISTPALIIPAVAPKEPKSEGGDY